MDASPDVLAETVRAKRVAVDNDLELLRIQLQRADPRRLDAGRWARRVMPIAAGAAGLWLWARRRRRVDSLQRLLVHALRDLYQGEQQVLPALKKLRDQASNEDLEQVLEQHRIETEWQIERLERVFRSVGATPKGGNSTAITTIVRDGERLLGRKVDGNVRDAWLIATAQRIEHLEIANYGTARTYAELLGYALAAELLQQSLEEERGADERLTTLAERFINPRTIRSAHH